MRHGFNPWQDPLEKETATHSSILAMDRRAWQTTIDKVTKTWSNLAHTQEKFTLLIVELLELYYLELVESS